MALRLRISRKLLIALPLLVILAFAAAWVVTFFIPTEKYEKQLVQALRDATGYDVEVKGKASLTLLPQAMLEVRGIELLTLGTGSRMPTLKIESVRAYTTLGALLSGTPKLTSVMLVRPAVEIERGQDKAVQWGWMSHTALAKLLNPPAAQGAQTLAVPELSVFEGKVSYRNPRLEYGEGFENINLRVAVQPGGAAQLSGNLVMRGQTVSMQGRVDAAAEGAPNEEAPFSLVLKASNGDNLSASGKKTVLDGKPRFNGTLSLAVADMLLWSPKAPQQAEEDAKAASPVTAASPQMQAQQAEKPRANIAFPVKLKAELLQADSSLALRQGTIEIADARGDATLDVAWSAGNAIKLGMSLDVLHLNQWQALLQGWLFDLERDRVRRDAANNGIVPSDVNRNPIPDDVQMNIDLKAKSLAFPGGRQWRDVALQAELAEGAMTVNQCDVSFAPDSHLTVFGLISYSSRGVRFEGNLETRGKDLRSLLAVFDQQAQELPDRGMGAFIAKSNLFMSAEQIRVSEANLTIGELNLVGGLVTYFEAMPRVEAEVRLQGINLDYFRDLWREKKMKERTGGFTLLKGREYDFRWIRDLGVKLDFKVVIDNFTFLERQGQRASFRIFADSGEAGLYGVKMLYPDGMLDASLELNVNGEKPFLDIVMTTNRFDTSYLAVNPRLAELPAPPPPPPPPGTPPEQANNKWSEDLFETAWATGWNGEFDLNIGDLTHSGHRLDNFKLKAKLVDDSMAIRNLKFGLWGGGFEGAGTLALGKVPALSLSFSLYNTELREIIGSVSSYGNVSGRASISGTATTAGINLLSWVSRANVNLAIAARGVWVRTFNLQGVMDSVNAARSVADVVNNVNRTIGEGATEFSLDGTFNLKDGLLRTPGATLRSGGVTGTMTGDLRVIPWLMNASILFQFPSFPSETVPTLTVDLSGSADAPVLRTDTSSLEAFVAKRIVGR